MQNLLKFSCNRSTLGRKSLFLLIISILFFSCNNIEDFSSKLENQEIEVETTTSESTEVKPSDDVVDTPPNTPSVENDFNSWTPVGPSLTYDEETDSVTVVDDYGTRTYPIAKPGEIDSSKLLYQYCTPQEKYVYEAYVYAWKNSKPGKYYFKEPITADELREGYNAFVNDWPEAWNVSLAFQGIQLLLNGEWKVVGVEISITTWDYESKKVRFDAALEDLRTQYNRKVTGESSTEAKLYALFNLVRDGGTFGITYDYSPGAGYSNSAGHTVRDLLVNKKGVCEGFGKLFSFVAREFGLGNTTALGGFAYDWRTKKEAGHVWCAVRADDGKWFQVDPTWHQWKSNFDASQHRLTGASAKWWEAVNK